MSDEDPFKGQPFNPGWEHFRVRDKRTPDEIAEAERKEWRRRHGGGRRSKRKTGSAAVTEADEQRGKKKPGA